MFINRKGEGRKRVSFSCALHLGMPIYQRLSSRSGCTMKLTSELSLAKTPSRSLQKAPTVCHMVM